MRNVGNFGETVCVWKALASYSDGLYKFKPLAA